VCFFLQTNLPVFKVKESSVRRRYSDFEWLRNELERDSKVGMSHNLMQLTAEVIKPINHHISIADCCSAIAFQSLETTDAIPKR
jgi:hypothetical protein